MSRSPVEEIYNDAVNAMSTEQVSSRAARLFDEVERQHPYSVWATRAQSCKAAYALYQVNKLRRRDQRAGPLHPVEPVQPRRRPTPII